MINKGKEVRTICWVNVLNRYIESILGNWLSLIICNKIEIVEIFSNYYFNCKYSLINDIYNLLNSKSIESEQKTSLVEQRLNTFV